MNLFKKVTLTLCLLIAGSILTMADTHIYRGRYTNSSDIVLTYGGPVPVPFLMMGVL